MPDKVSIIIVNKWVLKLSFICFCESAVFLCLAAVCVLNRTSEFLGPQLVGVQMVLKEGGLLSLYIRVPLLSMVGVQMVLKEGGLKEVSFLVCQCAIAFNGRSSDDSERRWTSFPVCLYRCAIWLVSMLAFMLVSVLRLVDSVPLLCTFLEVSMCVVASALWLKPGSATKLELSISSCWKFCGTLLGVCECADQLGVPASV